MTSVSTESVSTILVSCKQTRFHIENPNYRELDIQGLDITVTTAVGDKPSVKGKGKAKSEGTELFVNAKLQLKAGQRYALLGRNGSGKSTLLRAISEKLIPGIPEKTRISILQQTNADDVNTDEVPDSQAKSASSGIHGRTVLEAVIDKATSRNELELEIKALSQGVDSADSLGALRALRHVRHERLRRELFILDKDARLRSGMRGLQARKALTAFEKTFAESKASLEEDGDEIPADALQAETQEATDMLAELQIQVEPTRIAEIEATAKKILTGLGFSDAYMNKSVDSLSGGWRMRTALAAALLSETDILILDEPTNFLDLLGIIWLQRHLQSLEDSPDAPTLIVVSHDRAFITLCTDLVLVRDKALTYYHGDLPSYESARAEKRQGQLKMKAAQDRQRAHLEETIARNTREGRRNGDDTRVRQAKMRQRKLDDRWGLERNARGGRFKLNRDLAGWHHAARAAIDVAPEDRGVDIALPDPPDLRFPGPLISIEGASYRYPAPAAAAAAAAAAVGAKGSKLPPPAPLVLDAVGLTVHMGDRVGILGLNGAGKSTLVRLLVDQAKPTRGSVATHPRLRLGYYSQHAVEALQSLGGAEPSLTALALLLRETSAAAAGAGGAEMDEGDVRAVLGQLGLPGRLASDVPLRKLSGGQLVRCELARVLWRRPHCLVLDEVTTHLDYETVAALRGALRWWDGAVVLVSHDRWFMRGVVEASGGDDDDEDEEDSDGPVGGEEVPRRRAVYRLRSGKMTLLENGVQEFEESMEKRVKKMLDS